MFNNLNHSTMYVVTHICNLKVIKACNDLIRYIIFSVEKKREAEVLIFMFRLWRDGLRRRRRDCLTEIFHKKLNPEHIFHHQASSITGQELPLEHLLHQSSTSLNSVLINRFYSSSQLSLALSLLGKILKLVFEPDKVTLGSLVNRFYLKNRVSEAVSLYADMLVMVNSLSGREACDNYGKLVSRVWVKKPGLATTELVLKLVHNSQSVKSTTSHHWRNLIQAKGWDDLCCRDQF